MRSINQKIHPETLKVYHPVSIILLDLILFIKLQNITIKQAIFSEQEKIYQWLACSDATAEMLGPPNYADAPIPSYQEFCNDYNQEAFSLDGDFRLFVIEINLTEIGALSYYVREKVAEFDLWIASRSHWNKGWGSTALLEGISIVKKQETVDFAIIRPSARNKRAVAAYCKAGFEHYDPNTNLLPSWCLTEGKDYEDAELLFQKLN